MFLNISTSVKLSQAQPNFQRLKSLESESKQGTVLYKSKHFYKGLEPFAVLHIFDILIAMLQREILR